MSRPAPAGSSVSAGQAVKCKEAPTEPRAKQSVLPAIALQWLFMAGLVWFGQTCK